MAGWDRLLATRLDHPSNHMPSSLVLQFLRVTFSRSPISYHLFRNHFVKTIRTSNSLWIDVGTLGSKPTYCVLNPPLYRPRNFGGSRTRGTWLTHSLKFQCVACTSFHSFWNHSAASSRARGSISHGLNIIATMLSEIGCVLVLFCLGSHWGIYVSFAATAYAPCQLQVLGAMLPSSIENRALFNSQGPSITPLKPNARVFIRPCTTIYHLWNLWIDLHRHFRLSSCS